MRGIALDNLSRAFLLLGVKTPTLEGIFMLDNLSGQGVPWSGRKKMGWFKVLGIALASSCAVYAVTVSNPIIWADNPDPAIVRVDDAYYMVSTTMYYAPGVPVMKSTDLAQWRTVGYAYQTLINNDEQNLNNGKSAYAKGSWASCIRYHKGYFYVLTPSYTSGKTHIYKTADVENGPWSEVQLPYMYHDPSLFFDDDGTAWVIYGSGNEIKYVELNGDASGLKQNGRSGILGGVNIDQVTGSSNYYVKQEGSHMEKIDGKYYLFTISWPANRGRSSIVYRSNSLLTGYEGRFFLSDNGVAQGSIFDTPDGKWYTLLFRDSGPVGRIPHLVPTVWKDGWPEPASGTNKAPATLELPESPLPGYGMVTSDDFDSEDLPLEWQWNHNPDNKNWSLTANPGHLRITTGRTDASVLKAKNTLTQRTFGPKCSGRISLDGSGMKDGDIAGLTTIQENRGFVGLAKDGSNYKVVMYQGDKNGDVQKASEPISGSKVFLRMDFNLPLDKGTASFYYSTDGSAWTKIGSDVSLNFSLDYFTGNRFGLFNYATKTAGGYADFDWFKIGSDYMDEIYLDNTQEVVPPTPYGGKALTLPGRIEAENFDEGKPYKAYSDNDGENKGKAYRETGVDIVGFGCSDEANTTNCEGYALGYTAESEWLRYTVNFEEAGEYDVRVNMATPSEKAGVKLYIDGKAVTDEIFAKQNSENDWSTYSVVSAKTSEIAAGEHTLKLEIVGNNVNVDWIEICKGECKTSSIAQRPRLDVHSEQNYRVYSLNGRFMGSVSAASIREAQTKIQTMVPHKGVYFIKFQTVMHRVIVK